MRQPNNQTVLLRDAIKRHAGGAPRSGDREKGLGSKTFSLSGCLIV